MPLEAAEHHYREDHTHPEDDRPKNVALNVGIKRPNQLSELLSWTSWSASGGIRFSMPPSARRLSVSGCYGGTSKAQSGSVRTSRKVWNAVRYSRTFPRASAGILIETSAPHQGEARDIHTKPD